MSKTTELAITKVKREEFYKTLLLFYPAVYREHFGQEMLFVFEDLYYEELHKRGKVGLHFWLSVGLDTLIGAFAQHCELLKKQGARKYVRQTLGLNAYNILGGLLLLPIFIMFGIELISRLIQGDIFHYNRLVYAFLSHTPLYWYPVLLTWVFIFPSLAIVLNLIPLISQLSKVRKNIFTFSFALKNSASLLLISLAALFILFLRLHDFLPCFVHGIGAVGFGQLSHIMSVCRNA